MAALELDIPSCIFTPSQPHHPPPPEKSLRIQIEGPLVSIQKLFPEIPWPTDAIPLVFLQPAGPELARLTYQKLYGPGVLPEDVVVRDEYLGWVMVDGRPLNAIDYYGVTFDYLVPAEDEDPEVLQINIIEIDDDEGAYAHEYLPFTVNPEECTGKKVLAVPRCCQKRKGTQDRGRVNSPVTERDRRATVAREDRKLVDAGEETNE